MLGHIIPHVVAVHCLRILLTFVHLDGLGDLISVGARDVMRTTQDR